MKKHIYLSRSFVEFGPFLVEELLVLHERGALTEMDHVRHEGHHNWTALVDWLKEVKATRPAAESPSPVKKKAAKKTAKKGSNVRSPAKKAATKNPARKKKPETH